MSVETLRRQIDRIDANILRLLNRRAALGLRVGMLKKRQGRHLFDPRRERTVLHQVTRANHGPLPPRAVRTIYREILRQIRRLERSA